MTIGEREQVPFVQHDHFVDEWEAVGRILVKGFFPTYYPIFLSKAFICYCLFGNPIPDKILLDSFQKYLSPSEEEMVESLLKSSGIPEDREEFDDFLERFRCRTNVKDESLLKVLLEIARQELIQKPHLMIASWQSVVQELMSHEPFGSVESLEAFYEDLKPTAKKILNSLMSNPVTEGERDAFKFLQKFIRGLDSSKILQFLRYTTGMDVMKKGMTIEVTYMKIEGRVQDQLPTPVDPSWKSHPLTLCCIQRRM